MASLGEAPTVALTPRGAKTLTIDGGPAPEQPGAFEAGWTESGRYALVRELARGGGGRVSVSIDRKLGRRVALKRPLDPEGGARLEQEAFVLARLEHPSIVPIHDAGRDHDGLPFYTMKLVDGDTFTARIEAATTFDDRLALLPTLTAVAEAMGYAHAQGVIHRDLKPSNVVVGAFGEVAVIDWGLGKLVDGALAESHGVTTTPTSGELTAHDSIVGTPAYMAPEQARGPVVDRRADVYAIGAMLYHLLSGDLPYPRSSIEDTLTALRTSPPPAIETREPKVPRDLGAIVARAMAYDAGERYPSAAELAEDLRRYQTGRLVAAHHYPAYVRAWRWLRRHQGRVALATGALALAAAGTLWATTNRVAAEAPCRGLDAPVLAVWNPTTAAPIAKLFTASPVPGAVASWRTITAELDAHATQITNTRVAACQASRITGAESRSTLDLQMTCLDRRTAELGNFVGWLAAGDHTTIGKAVDGLGVLGRVADCADLTRLHDIAPMPADPIARATIATIDNDLDKIVTGARDGKYLGADAAAAAIVERARVTGYEPLRARALYQQAQLLVLQTKTPETLALAAAALVSAEKAGADRLRADILALQLHVELNTLQHVDVAAALADQITAIGERVHDPTLVAEGLGDQAQIDLQRDHVPDAIAHAEQALAQLPDPKSREGWAAQGRLAQAYVAAHRLDDAKRIFDGLIASRRAVIGTADDPNLANDLVNLAVITSQQGNMQHAIELLTEATGMLDRTLPPDAKSRLQAHTRLASLESAVGRTTDARTELLALLPVAETKLGHDHQAVADIVFRIAETHEHENDYADAIVGYRDALARYTAAAVPIWIAKCHGHLGTVLLAVNQPKDALPELVAALQVVSQLRGADSPEAAVYRGDVGRTELVLGDAKHAIADLERALVPLDADNLVDRGLYNTALAEAHWQLGDKPRALELGKLARDELEAAGADGKSNLIDLTAWEHDRK